VNFLKDLLTGLLVLVGVFAGLIVVITAVPLLLMNMFGWSENVVFPVWGVAFLILFVAYHVGNTIREDR